MMKDEMKEYSRELCIKQNNQALIHETDSTVYLINPFTKSFSRINRDMKEIWDYLEQLHSIQSLIEHFQLDDEFDTVIKALIKKGYLQVVNLKSEFSPHQHSFGFGETKLTGLAIFPTHSCNLKCSYCYASGGDRTYTIPKEYIDVVMDYFFERTNLTKGSRVGLDFHGGGEPTQAFDVMKYAVNLFKDYCVKHEFQYRFGMATNACFDDEVLNWLVENKFDFSISFDGPPDIQNSQRPMKNGRESHVLVEGNIKKFLEKGVEVAVRSTITDTCVNRLPEIVKYIANLGVKFIHLEPCFEVGRSITAEIRQPMLDVFLEKFLEAFQWANRHGIHLKTSSLRATDSPGNRFCGACGSNLAITPDGYISTCYEVVSIEDPASSLFFVGKIVKDHDGKNLIMIDENKLDMLNKRTVENIPGCHDCFSKYWCAGDCPVKAYRDTGSLIQIRPERCDFIKKANEEIIKMIIDERYYPVDSISVLEY